MAQKYGKKRKCGFPGLNYHAVKMPRKDLLNNADLDENKENDCEQAVNIKRQVNE
jgi:hypothetical protein